MKSVRSHPLAGSALSFLFTLFAAVTPPAGAIDLTGLDRGLTLAGHPDGGWLALSSDTLSATSDVVIEAVRVAPDGTVGPNFFTSELHPIEVNVEAAVVAPSGRWVAVWRSEDRDFENSRFSATIFGPDGELVSALDLAVTSVATFYVEAMMDLRPWSYWMPDGTPYEGTERIVGLIESILERNPDRPGALHLYIHLMEALHPERHPENGWALSGLARALRAQGKKDQTAVIEARFTKAWERADVVPASSRWAAPAPAPDEPGAGSPSE